MGGRWAGLELECYRQLHLASFSKVQKLNLAADPSTYSGEDTMIGLLWSWEIKEACCGIIQVTSAGPLRNPEE